ncbi:DUF3037 domain-containing protein [Tumebacillus sp. ITR2]|uniref:DUF3037 domain-containing protein n=1 Tax=Tumebacillus amylolyticus TaxID=2801339 RepID=A0ABS1JE92_9BACL|nr:DUF3037 domain-containing protein [Tumebacillus amylolyticus]MBL0388563.1 DUF3037 domain-containing protein [Tumebacillus amylolyticus]
MSGTANFTILRYVPNIEREEFVNMGVLLHCPEQKFLRLKTTDTLTRIRAFDDELDIEMFKMILSGISEEFDKSSFKEQYLSNTMLISEITSHYVNQLQFSDIRTLLVPDTSDFALEEELDLIFKTFVYYEVSKSTRVTDKQVQSLMSRTFKDHKIISYLNKKPTVKGSYEEVEFDYGLNDMEYIKALSFDYSPKQASRAPELARNWAFIFREIKEKTQLEKQTNPEFITVIHVSDKIKNKHLTTALDIIDSESKIYYSNEMTKLAEHVRKQIINNHNSNQLRLDIQN